MGPPLLIELLSDPDSVVALLPKDAAGNIDWVAALKEGVIRPRRALPSVSPPPDMSGFGFDFLIKGPAPMFDAFFPHSVHAAWLSCQTCHPGIFPYHNEAITMQVINSGKACGVCHGTVAFPTDNCGRCHRQMGTAAGADQPNLIGDHVFAHVSDSTAPTPSSFQPVVFRHWRHRIRYRCMACHPGLYEARAGGTTVTMDDMRRGKGCGACHDGSTAFPLMQCGSCHVPRPENRGAVP